MANNFSPLSDSNILTHRKIILHWTMKFLKQNLFTAYVLLMASYRGVLCPKLDYNLPLKKIIFICFFFFFICLALFNRNLSTYKAVLNPYYVACIHYIYIHERSLTPLVPRSTFSFFQMAQICKLSSAWDIWRMWWKLYTLFHPRKHIGLRNCFIQTCTPVLHIESLFP